MSFSAGVFSINTSGQPVVTGTVISSTVFNALTADLATGLSTCVLKDGTQTITANIPMAGFKFTGLGAGSATGNSLRYEQLFTTSAVTLLGAMDWVKGADIASATTVNLTTATGNGVHITGTTTITAVTLGSGMWRLVVFDGILTLTHHATNNNLPGGANITTAANDRALYWADGTTVYCAAYQKANGKATVSPAVGDITGLGTGVATALAVNVYSAGAFSLKTITAEQATTSGTAIDFTGIPSGVSKISVMFYGVSTNGTSPMVVQIGDAGGIEDTGYASGVMFGATAGSATASYIVTQANSAADVYNGTVTINLQNRASFKWVSTGLIGDSSNGVHVSNGAKALSAELNSLRITTAGGVNTFDVGAISISYE